MFRQGLLEAAAVLTVIVVLAGVPASIWLFQRAQSADAITLVARAHEAGGWSLRDIHVRHGEMVKLRLTSEDVEHGFAIPELGIRVDRIDPGKYVEVEFPADKVGEFAFYCTVICSSLHTRMTGTLHVVEG